MTLEASEFIRRFLQHVLPRGFHKVRYYGFLSPPRNRRLREQVQWQLTRNTETGAVESPASHGDSTAARDQSALLCPLCHEGYLIMIMALPRRWRAPP